MQNIHRGIIVKLGVLFLGLFYSPVIQGAVLTLEKADSLFLTKQYKEALVIYEHLLYEEASYSPAMLLKMAFISEGMGDFGKATKYLSKYYDNNPNPKVITKIKSLTSQGTLYGYDVSDREKFFKFLIDVQAELTVLFVFFAVLMLIFALIFRQKKAVFYAPTMVFLLLGFLSNNFLRAPEMGIITGSPTLVMDSPTAAGNLIRKVDVGHRVRIEASVDSWYEVTWNNRKAYIRKDRLSKI
ncbi:hypothetical protein ADIS_3766 [Lunatimonas lonarensis]|uniref:SH3b domain-containing protein n=1 Tax=Lunatimonas lonarensis TaxID=1232681 RepID=R7ZNY5_9BACT|nr:SH3 domain-containing protein [Lunatimonas lonarensis]EON75734.1 hypothetical protein ADIS_3766 [Lunatimonas lonarensis]